MKTKMSQLGRPPEGLVEVRTLDKVYQSRGRPITALNDVSLRIGSTEFVSLLGPSGCGKSTLLRCVAGLESPTSGEVLIRGRRVHGPVDGMSIVFQRDVLLDWLTVLRNVLLPSKVRGLNIEEWIPKARALLELMGLAGFEDRYPWELSGGMRQRVAICRALLLNPSLLLMDEPFGALDAITRDELNLEMQRVWLVDAKTVLFVTHSIPEAVFLSDRIAVMSRAPGRIVDILDIDLARPRELSIREGSSFIGYAARIRKIFESFGMLRGAYVRE
jgi:NitT/TauT family transport system ATP-binding protein